MFTHFTVIKTFRLISRYIEDKILLLTEFRFFLCENELHDSTVISKCPYFVSKYHMNCINEYLSEKNDRQNCGKGISVK